VSISLKKRPYLRVTGLEPLQSLSQSGVRVSQATTPLHKMDRAMYPVYLTAINASKCVGAGERKKGLTGKKKKKTVVEKNMYNSETGIRK